MYLNSMIYPPVGSTTVLSADGAVKFMAVLEVTNESNNDWIVELWYGRENAEWESAAFLIDTTLETAAEFYDGSPQKGRIKNVYTLDLPLPDRKSFKYTMRFRPNRGASWSWHGQGNNGQIIFRPLNIAASLKFETLFSEPDDTLSVKSINSQVVGVHLFDVTSVAPALNEAWSTVNLGKPVSLEKFYATARVTTTWLGPQHGTTTFAIDKDALLVMVLRSDGYHVAVLAVSGLGNTTTVIGSNSGHVLLKSRNDSGTGQQHRAIVAVGPEWQPVVDAAFYAARDLILNSINEQTADLEVMPFWRETWYDGLGYCSWNSLGPNVSEESILDALQGLYDNDIRVSTLIIDDGWQSVKSGGGWDKFEANSKFPSGLAGLVQKIKSRFPTIKHVAVWHSILGYWGNIAPDGWIAASYRCTTVKWQNSSDTLVVDEPDVNRLYDDFYRFLYNSGVDSVKCDYQAALEEFNKGTDRMRLGQAYQDALKINGLKYLSGRVLYCMSHVPDIFFHSLLQRNHFPVVLRNSDDFFPNIPSSHAWHIFANALNCIYTSHFNCVPDWDMFQTVLPVYAPLHAAGRAISGGPIYITDQLGHHSTDIITSLTAPTLRTPSHSAILRPSRVALPVDPYTDFHSNRLLQVVNYWGSSKILAVFNISPGEISELVTVSPPSSTEREFVIRQHSTGRVFGPCSGQTTVSLAIPSAGWEFLTTSCLHKYRGGTASVAVLGLLKQLCGAAGVERWGIEDGEQSLYVVVKALGLLGIFVSDFEDRSVDECLITIQGKVVPVDAVVKGNDCRMLELDLEMAWKQLEPESGWAGEVVINVFLGGLSE